MVMNRIELDHFTVFEEIISEVVRKLISRPLILRKTDGSCISSDKCLDKSVYLQ